ncbi:MAG: PIN domain-containing protein [Chloroflexota bacterium]
MPHDKVIYWDSSIFIAWLKDEQRPPGEMDGVLEYVYLVEAKRIKLITSTLTRTEVFEANLTNDVREKYSKLLSRRNVQLIDADLRVAELARNLREYYQSQSKKDGTSRLTTADAIHLATAIHYRVDEFHTFDDGKKGGLSLLSLNGNVAGYQLTIRKPPVSQYRLPI